MREKRARALWANKRFLFFANLFTEIKSLNAIIQLFYLSRGLNVGQIVYLSLIWSIVILLFELPSSYIADFIGRKRTLVFGILFLITGNIFMLFVNGFAGVSLAVIFMAIGFAFNSGTDEALLYDTLKELKQENYSTKVSGKYFSSSYLAKIIVPFLGTLIAKDLLPWQFNLLVLIDLTGSVLALISASLLVEPKRFESVTDSQKGIFKESIKLITGNPILLNFALNKILVFQAGFVFWRVYQIILTRENISVFWLGVIYIFVQGILFSFHWNIEKIRKKVGEYFLFWLSPVLGIIFISMLLSVPSKFVLIMGTVVIFTLGTYRDPLFLSQMQARIGSFNRATTTSALSVIKSITDIPILLVVGYFVNYNLNFALYMSLALFLSAAVFVPINKSSLKVIE